MTCDFFTTGINCHTTPVEVREKLSFGRDSATELLTRLKRESLVNEALYLSTCNRAEVYAVANNDDASDRVRAALCEAAGIDRSSTSGLWYTKRGPDAVTHLFRVASSLDAMVVGEAQVLGQIRDAYFAARETGTAGPFIERAMLKAFSVAKRVRAETDIGKGRVSVASVAVDLARRHLDDMSKCSVLVIGAGEMGALVVSQLKKNGARSIMIANRTFERAEMIAEHTGGKAISWDDIELAVQMSDIVVASTGSSVATVSEPMISKAMKARSSPLLLIDLGTPRDIEPSAAAVPGVHLFNIDALQGIARENFEKRAGEAKKAERLVEEEVKGFFSALSAPEHAATIAMLGRKFQTVIEAETERTLSLLSGSTEKERTIVENGFASILSKILHDPSRTLKTTGTDELERQIISDVLFRAFRLDEE